MWRFVWRVGVLQWGLTLCGMFVGMQIAQRPNRYLFILELNIPLWLCMGFLWGLLTWKATEWSYRRHVVTAGGVPGGG